jgi:DNA-directed RNA polymerase specialized sigma24 family protein
VATKLTPEAQAQLRAFYDIAYDHAWRYLARMTGGDKALTEDLVQEVMLAVALELRAGQQSFRSASATGN